MTGLWYRPSPLTLSKTRFYPLSEKVGLIELLVVISIIALLVAILMPALNKARQAATGAACVVNEKTMLTAWLMYAEENEDKIVSGWTGPIGWTGNPANNSLEAKKVAIEAGLLYDYITNVDAYHCPGDKREMKSGQFAFRSYSMPNCMNGDIGGWTVSNVGNNTVVKKVGQITHPATKYVFLEESDRRGSNKGTWVMDLRASNDRWIDPMAVWHNDKGTLGFADGHAEMHGWLEEETITMCRDQVIWQKCNGKLRDWKYMRDGWHNNKSN